MQLLSFYVKKKHFLISVLLLPLFVFAQQTLPSAYDENTKVNFVRTWDAKAPESSSETLKSRSLRDVQQNTQYFDGLGRPLQTVTKKGSLATNPADLLSSTAATDMVVPMIYDQFGRQAISYLPAPANSTGSNTSINDGLFKLNPFQQQVAFYNNQLAGQTGETNIGTNGENWAYTKTNYEPSPLNRVSTTYAPGANWVGSEGAATKADKHGVHVQYLTNTELDEVRIWEVEEPTSYGSFGSCSSTSDYPEGELFKTITIDEHDKQTIEFKDKEGKVILKKVQPDHNTSPDNGSGVSHADWMCTYYIYDDLGNLRCVIQPEGVKALEPNGWQFTTTILNHQCFRYEYDQRNRMIMKKVPGILETDALWMVYDIRDRMVMTQDGKQRALNPKFWVVILYDELNRPVQTGYYNASHPTLNNKTFAQILADAADQIDYPFAATARPTASYYTVLTETGYDNYDAMLSAGVPPSLTKFLDNTTINSTYLNTTYNTFPLYAQQPIQSFQTEGLVTWTKVKLFGGDYFEYTVNIYDDKGRLIQVKHRNYIQSGTAITTNQYNWAGQLLRSVQWYYKPGTNAHSNYVLTDMSYDDLGRLVLTKKKMYNGLLTNTTIQSTPWTTIAENEYDALGQLKTKKLGKRRNSDGSYSDDALATLEYSYNIRGWLLSINKDYINNSDADRYFAMELGYDKDPSLGANGSKQYNGNIGSILWKSAGDEQRRKYDFTYDAANRLMGAAFGQYASGTGASAVFNTSAGIDFTVNGLGYDYNGNITGMTHIGLKVNSSAPIDKLIYTYEAGTNRLQKVTEDGTIVVATNGKLGDFKDGTNGATADYAYNQNGSITKDLNKGITSITYQTTQELPRLITTGNGTVEFRQDVLGNKVWKTVIDNSVVGNTITTVTKYVEGFIYESKTFNPDPDNLNYNDKLLYTPHEEGRIRALYNNAGSLNTLTGFAYDYFIKDHLGNVRMVLTDELKQNIYPAATLEGDFNSATSAVAEEKKFYTIDEGKIVTKSVDIDYPNKNGGPGELDPIVNPNLNGSSTATSLNMYKLKATSDAAATGLGITLRVMSGDKIDIFGTSYYEDLAPNNGAGNQAITTLSILTGLLSGEAGAAASATHGGVTNVILDGNTGIKDAIGPAFTYQSTLIPNSDRPKAFINYIFFDEQFKAVKYGSSPVRPILEAGQVKHHTDLTNIPAPKNGYVYIYVSNQSQVDVFFDNLQVIHTRGQILEETHYYPFGLTMAGISSKALNNAPINKFGITGKEIQNKEFSDGSGLELYDFSARTYDQQIGRFLQIDPNSFNYYAWTPYNYCANNPIAIMDPTGMDWYTDKNGMYQYDPNITKDSKLKEGETYVGVTHQIKDKKGNITEDYRKDGSIMYAKESSAYTRIIERSEQTGNESMAALTDNGTLVLPDYKNDKSTVDLADYGYSTKNGNIVDASGKEYNTTATVHTHPDGSGPSTYTANGYGDLGFAAYSTPNKPVFVIQMQGGKNDPISFIIAAPNPTRKAANFNFQTFPVTRQIPSLNAQSIQNLSNSVNLKQFVKQNKDNIIQLLRK